MIDTFVTMTGNVTDEPRLRVTTGGLKVTSFGMACTERRLDQNTGVWRDGDTMFARVSCWRSMAENVVDSIAKGQPVVVHGRLRLRSWDDAKGERHTELDINARAVGHDLTRGVASFRKANSAGRPAESDLSAAGPSPVGPAPDVWAAPLMPPDDDPADAGDIGDAPDTADLRDEERAAGAA
ncbi:MAG TPA: single-stranded DNA-binding protein [Actinomycetes bacterium]|jgi:single-strand DNA-binding protein|nr:single-stranded DNA-binding protein [Actinomycetes bacterium]